MQEDYVIHAKSLRHYIKEIISDNEGEFDSEAIREILKKCGKTQMPIHKRAKFIKNSFFF